MNWLYTEPAFGRTGRSLSENNFAKERRNWVAILLREILQNGLDARLSRNSPVIVKIAEKVVPHTGAVFFNSLITPEHLDRFKKSINHNQDPVPESMSLLVIEDFGTTGLTGVTDSPNVDGKGQNWNAFWFREGEGGKEHGSGNGGAGQGKITYFSTSAVRTIFAYTVRNDDGKEALYGASSFLRDYEYNSSKWLRDSYWGLAHNCGNQKIAIPTSSASEIAIFREMFGVTRRPSETGLSLVIPYPKQFSREEAIQITIAEFFAPILRGDLVVIFGDVILDASSIMKLADACLSDDKARELNTCTTKAYRAFVKEALRKSQNDDVLSIGPLSSSADIVEASFTPESLEMLRNALQQGEQIAVRIGVVVTAKTGQKKNCHFDVHLMCPDDLNQAEEAVIRMDLLIGEEPARGAGMRQKARGLTLISDPEISPLLLSAEEATHLKWNTRLPRLREYYRSGAEVVSIVRNSMARLLDVLTAGEEKRDFRLLAKFFPVPGSGRPHSAKGERSRNGKELPLPGPIPPPQEKKLILQPLPTGCVLMPNSSCPATEQDMPITGELQFAYEGLDKDAFAEYDQLDFDLADSGFVVESTSCLVKEKSLNRIRFVFLKPDFKLSVRGFDQNMRLRVRLNYKETAHASAVDPE